MVMRFFTLIVLLGGAAVSAVAEFADYHFEPAAAAPEKGAIKAAEVASDTVAKWKRDAFPGYQIEDYAGRNAALKADRSHPALQVATGAALDWAGEDLFAAPEKANGRYVWRAAIRSVDANALRLRVELSGLHPEARLWVVDTAGVFAFGPYTLADADESARWLPTTAGDTAILVVESPAAEPPAIVVRALSHFYEDIFAKGTDCPISADCIEDAALQEITAGIGRLSVTDDDGNGALCSGALLNNALSEGLEGFFLTADHCFQDFPATVRATNVEVIWDLRTNGCPGSEPAASEIAALPRSSGTSFLGNSTSLDIVLLALGTVPVGDRGRAWLGWDTRTPGVGNPAVGLHHPAATAQKESLGAVEAIGVDTAFGQGQTSILWSEGITEGGSSGSPVMFNDTTFRVFGVLSNGNQQTCDPGDQRERRDQYSSFRDFFTESAGEFLNTAAPSLTGSAVYSRTDGGGNGMNCTPARRGRASSTADMALVGLVLATMLATGSRRWTRR